MNCCTLSSVPKMQQYMQHIWIMFANGVLLSWETFLFLFYCLYPLLPAVVSSAICSWNIFSYSSHTNLCYSLWIPVTDSIEHMPRSFFLISVFLIACYIMLTIGRIYFRRTPRNGYTKWELLKKRQSHNFLQMNFATQLNFKRTSLKSWCSEINVKSPIRHQA